MKGLYILVILVAALAVLGYLVMAPTDADLRRKYDRLIMGRDALEAQLAEQKEPLAYVRSQKRRTFKLDKEYTLLQTRASKLRTKLNVALHNVENLSSATRKATEDVLDDLAKDLNKQLTSAGLFAKKVSVLHDFVKESFPLHGQLMDLQRRMNLAVAQQPDATADTLKDVESYNMLCEQISKSSSQAMTTLHTNLDQAEILAGTAVNEMKKLIPTLEAFVEGLEKGH
jgi:chromosome segregation ATPase